MLSFRFQVSARVNTAGWPPPGAPYVGRVRRTAAGRTDGAARVEKRGKGRGGSAVGEAPCWPRCTGRRTSAGPTGLRTRSERSSGCSRVRPELQQEREFVSQSSRQVLQRSKSKNGCDLFSVAQLAELFLGHVCFSKMQRQHRVSQPLGVSTNYVVTCQQKTRARRTYGWTPAGRRLPAR